MTEELVLLECIVDNPYQPRTTDNADHIENLARSIAADGLLQRPAARHTLEGAELAFGHSRRKAFEWLRVNWKKEGLRERYNNYSQMPLNFEELSDEEMYRFAVSENVQRKDLDPIEIARAMIVYRDQFGKSSKEIGELFSMNDATARGKMRLLDLPEEVKTDLSAGEISESVARDILSLQKIAPLDVVLSTVEQVKKGETTFHTDATPREIIMDAVEDLKNVEQLTWSQADDKKRPTVKNDGWALDMKKFPNHYLPLLTEQAAVQVLNCSNDKTIMKLVQEIVQYLIADTEKDADDDYHRANANQIEKRLERLAEIDTEYRSKLETLLNPPACASCQSITKFDGVYFCGIKACYERKMLAWQRHGLDLASKKLGVTIYVPSRDGNCLMLEDTYRNDAHEEMWKKKNPDLRLAYMLDIDRKKYQSGYEGCPKGCVVVLVGKTLEKSLEVKEQKREEKKFDVNEFRDDLMQGHIDTFLWEATSHLKSVLDGLTDKAIASLYDAPRYGWSSHSAMPDPDFSGNEDEAVIAEHTRREVVLFMLISGDDGVMDTPEDVESLSALAGAIQARARDWKMKLPAAFLKHAAQLDTEIAEAVAAETARRKKKTKE